MNQNVQLNYLYRDAGNYKAWGEVYFSNPSNKSKEEIESTLHELFEQGVFFIAHFVDIPEVFIYGETDLNDDDHCFHEFDSIKFVEMVEKGDNFETIDNFIEKVKSVSETGWSAFDPRNELINIRHRMSKE